MRAAWALAAVVAVGIAGVGACRSGPPRRAESDSAFVRCVGDADVKATRDERSDEVVVQVVLGSPAEALAFAERADRCGPWRFDDQVPAYVRVVVATERCARGGDCAAGWESALIKAVKDVGKTAAASAPGACERVPTLDWRGWVADFLLRRDPDVPLATWVERAVMLNRAGMGSAEAAIEARLADDRGGALARLALEKIPNGSESMRFHAAMSLVRAGDEPGALVWLKDLAERGTTVFRAFARAEIERLTGRP